MESPQEPNLDQMLEQFPDEVIRETHTEHVSEDTHDPESPVACAVYLPFPS